MKEYGLNLVLGEPIRFYDICTIYQPTLKNIMDISIDKYNELLMPYIINKECLNIENEELTDFDLLTLKIQEKGGKTIDLLSLFLQSLIFFCRDETVGILNDNGNIAFTFNNDKNRAINKDNFDEFTNIILKINNAKKIEKEKEYKDESPAKKAIREKILKGRAKYNKPISLGTIVNIVKFGMDYYIDKKMLKEFTIWELYNAYEGIMKKEQYKNNFEICLVAGNEDNELDMTHWSKSMIINEEP